MPGAYHALLRQQDGMAASLSLIHEEYWSQCVDHWRSDEDLPMKLLGTVQVSGALLWSDPCYVYDDVRVDPMFPRYRLSLWGRDVGEAQAWLDQQEIPFEMSDGAIDVYGDGLHRLEQIRGRLRAALRTSLPDLRLVDWIKDTGNLYEQLQVSYQPRVVSWTRNGQVQSGAICTTGYGDGLYTLQTVKIGGQIVGYHMPFVPSWNEDEDELPPLMDHLTRSGADSGVDSEVDSEADSESDT
jgi:hypothetical protein